MREGRKRKGGSETGQREEWWRGRKGGLERERGGRRRRIEWLEEDGK